MNILFFASLKENLNTASETITIDEEATVASIKNQLIERHGAKYFPKNILCAVNHEMVDDYMVVTESDEVAFFPPVTGG
ncbi:MAG TPA: molybdopterin converting factor subunit 1 [Candidatus Thioglobus sp.]|jgi:molybdopterin synthase sulfur carrier subunit|nr:molybdopterin converting factor subunit 1 [Candidatus Thioglobus sp.]